VKWSGAIWFKKLTEKRGISINREAVVFSFFLILAFIFWYLNSLEKTEIPGKIYKSSGTESNGR
jgi:Na+-transporting methylmalonyl-CoA/oxaloacetate decarboxylase gamma subunit